MCLIARLAERDHVIQSCAKLFLGELRVPHEVVHVAHEGTHDLAEARVGRAPELAQYGLGDVFLALDDHDFFFIGSFTASKVANSTLYSSPSTFSTLRI